MLHKGVEGFPAKAFGQFLRSNGPVAELKLVKDSLKGKGHTSLCVVALCGHLVNGLS